MNDEKISLENLDSTINKIFTGAVDLSLVTTQGIENFINIVSKNYIDGIVALEEQKDFVNNFVIEFRALATTGFAESDGVIRIWKEEELNEALELVTGERTLSEVEFNDRSKALGRAFALAKALSDTLMECAKKTYDNGYNIQRLKVANELLKQKNA